MILSHKYKFIFLKTRKTAGTSLEIALSRFCEEGDINTRIPQEDEKIRAQFSGTAAEGGAADPMAIAYVNHTRNITNFLETVATGRPLLIDGAEACKALAIIQAVYKSAGSGQAVTL